MVMFVLPALEGKFLILLKRNVNVLIVQFGMGMVVQSSNNVKMEPNGICSNSSVNALLIQYGMEHTVCL